MKVSALLSQIPQKLTEKLAQQTGVDHNVQRLRGQVMLDLLLFGLVNSDRLSSRVMEQLYASPLFEKFSGKDKGHKTRHSSIADRLKTISPAYFKAIFQWAYQHFSNEFGGTKWDKKIKRFDSTMIKISSALVEWGMQVGRKPKDHPEQLQLKVTLGMTGAFPESVNIYSKQDKLSEEKALYNAIINSSAQPDEMICFDAGLKARKSLQEFDNEGISFVTRGADNLRYKVVASSSGPLQEDEQTRIVQDSTVYLFTSNHEPFLHPFRLVEIQVKDSEKKLCFITNITDLDAMTIAKIYHKRWDIEVFFRFIKQELNIKHLLSHSLNGIKVQIYTTLLLAILLTVYTVANQLKGYKIPKIQFREELIYHIALQLNQGEKLVRKLE